MIVCVSCSVMSDSLCHPMDCSPPGFSVYRILQAIKLEWVAIPFFFRGSSWPRDQIQVSCIAGRFFTIWAKGKVTLNLLWLFSWYLSWTKSLKSYMAFYKINIFLEHWDGRLSSVTGPVIFSSFPFSYVLTSFNCTAFILSSTIASPIKIWC